MVACHLIAAFTAVKLPATGTTGAPSRSVWRDLFGGLSYVGRRRALPVILGLALARALLGMPYRTLMPKFAKKSEDNVPRVGGKLLAGPGIGSLVSSLVLASLGDFRQKGRLFMVAGVFLGACLAVFVNLSTFPLVFVVLILVGATGNACMVVNNTILQANIEDHFRGRVMSVYMLMFGLGMLGTIPAGAVSDLMGVRFVVTVQVVLFAAVFLLVMLFRPDVRRME
mgnify:CR=1 FL=1